MPTANSSKSKNHFFSVASFEENSIQNLRLFEIPSSARIQLTCLREKPENKYFVEVAAFDAVLFHFVHREHMRESKKKMNSQPDMDLRIVCFFF